MPNIYGHEVERTITDRSAFREILGEPSPRTKEKVIDRVDELARRFIATAPFAALATRRVDGGVDITPRGDPEGFAIVLDEKTIALPERPGNRRGDALENVLRDPHIGLLFIIPGHNDTIRVSGKATIVQDKNLAARMKVKSHTPELILLIEVQRLLCHCPKAFIRSSMWRPDGWPDTSNVPNLAELMIGHAELALTVEEMATIIENDRQTRLY
ncbi:MAG: MSMEG_1061 family FMN-dependent PPOX-type flavoprotein [Hyphomicrobiaceae bacterium]